MPSVISISSDLDSTFHYMHAQMQFIFGLHIQCLSDLASILYQPLSDDSASEIWGFTYWLPTRNPLSGVTISSRVRLGSH